MNQQPFNASGSLNGNIKEQDKDIKLHSLLIGFEGTGDQTFGTTNWATNVYGKRSFIKRACDRATEPEYAKYLAGPDAAGWELGNILSDAINFYDLKRMQVERRNEGLKVSLIGYSRGGHLAICFANYLKQQGVKIKFLGLFDAVARDFTGSLEKQYRTYKIPSNVGICYHALRIDDHSRQWFANTGLEVETTDTAFKKTSFRGTHAAIGGFPMDTPEQHTAKGFVRMDNKPYIVQAAAAAVYPGLTVRPIDEHTAWKDVASFMSAPLTKYNVISRPILE